MILLTLIFCYLFVGSLNIIVKRTKWLWILNSLLNIVVLILIKNKLPIYYYPGNWSPPFGIEILINKPTYTFLSLFSIIYPLINFYASFYEKNGKYFYGFINFLSASFISLIISNDLFNIFVSFELSSLISFILVGLKKNGRSIVAALRYMMVSAVAMNFYLLGLIMLYSQTGELSLTYISHILTYNSYTYIAFSFIISALLVKSGLVLYSMWLPLVYSSAKDSVSAILSSLIGETPIFVIYKFSMLFPKMYDKFSTFLIVLGIGSAIFGGIMAFLSKKAKLTLSYSTISQSGIMFTGLGLGNFAALPLYIFYHGIIKSLMFISVGEISKIKGEEIVDYKNIPFVFPTILILSSLALSGIPLFNIFFQKKLLIQNIYIGTIFTIITALYCGKFIKKINVKTKIDPKSILFFIPIIFLFGIHISNQGLLTTTVIILSMYIANIIKPVNDIGYGNLFSIEANLIYFIYLTTILTLIMVR